jgi:PIN domain nuclease of toxin-antitoxin system
MGEGLLIVLDTHIFVWMNLEPDRIPAEIQSAMDAETVFGIPAISLWEIAMLTGKGRLAITEPLLLWMRKALSMKKIRLLPVTPEIAVLSGGLRMHGDPADRLIAATAITCHARLATVDGNLLNMPILPTI